MPRFRAIGPNSRQRYQSMQSKSDSHCEGMDRTGSLRPAVSILLLWTISLLLAAAIVDAESLSFLDGRIRFYPTQREGERILIPFTQPPAEDEEVVLLSHHTALFRLRSLQKGTIMPREMINARPQYVYGLAEGRLSDPPAQFLIAVGKGIKSLLSWTAAGMMYGEQSADKCMVPDKGFSTAALQVLTSEELNAKFYYLQTTLDTMIDEDMSSGVSMKEIVGMVGPEGSCHVLAYNSSDRYGLSNRGTTEPVGPISGIIELPTGRSTERWLVLRSAMQEVWGYTFIELLPLPWNREPKRRFLVEGR